MDLGAFSVSLTVKDLATSREFYEKLGFEVMGGDMASNYLILKNDQAVIGLFQGMFDRNILTFNPGLSAATAGPVESFTDVREIQRRLREAGLELEVDTDEDGTGPAHVTLADPDGNPVLIDQFFDAPPTS